MSDSMYVIQKSTGMLYCVNVEHYNDHKDWYDLPEKEEVKEEPAAPVIEEVKTEPAVIKKPTRGRKAATKR